MTLVEAVVGLVLPVALGALCGATRVFDAPDRAVDDLNRFSLYVPFPALVVAVLGGDHAALPHDPVFWMVVPVTVGLALLPLKAVGDRLGGLGGALALVTVFGNVAYLGLPFLAAVRGDAAMATAGLLVGLYVFLSMLLGPLLVRMWSGGGGPGAWRIGASKALRSPLAWSPVVGVGLRAVPEPVRDSVVAVLRPLGAAAGPVALFLLGLYLHTHASRLRRVDSGLVALVATKMAWLPLVTWIGVTVGRQLGLDVEAARVVMLLSCMPPAITTFAIARDADVASDEVAQAIVAGTLMSAVSLPIVSWWVAGW